MGVMACSRRSCDSIMVDTYVSDVGYICDNCQEEFKKYLESEGKSLETKTQITTELQLFMETEKGTYSPKDEEKIGIDEFFRLHSY